MSVVLTGGPCGGKTTLLEELKAAARAAGVDVYTVPEVPSLLISNGAAYPGMVDPAKLLVYEETMTRLQLQVVRYIASLPALPVLTPIARDRRMPSESSQRPRNGPPCSYATAGCSTSPPI